MNDCTLTSTAPTYAPSLTRFLLLAAGMGGCSVGGADGTDDENLRSRRNDEVCVEASGGGAPSITTLAGPLSSSVPRAIVAEDDGVWFTDRQDVTLSHLAPDGALLRFPAPFPSEEVFDAAIGADDNVWFDNVTADRLAHIGRMTRDGEVTLFDIPSGARAKRLTRGPDGNVWFTAGENVGQIVMDGSIHEVAIGAVVGDIASGPDDAVWFTEPDENRIGRLSLDGEVTHFDVPTAQSGLAAITRGPDEHVWFTESNAGKIGRIGTAGVVREFDVVAPPASVRELTAGPDGRLWFTVQTGDFQHTRVGSLSPCGTVTMVELPRVADPFDFKPPRTVPAVPQGIAAGAHEIWVTARLEPFETGAVLRLDLDDTAR